MKSKIKLSPIQSEIIYTLINNLFNNDYLSGHSCALSSVIFGHYSYSSVITKAINGIVRKTGNTLITNTYECVYLNLGVISELGVNTKDKDELWKGLVDYSGFTFMQNKYVVLLRREKIYKEFVSRPSYFHDMCPSDKPLFSTLDGAKVFSFRQEANAMALKIGKSTSKSSYVSTARTGNGARSLLRVKELKKMSLMPDRILARANTPHIFTLK
ncbi:hypothetical protein LMH73_008755 [Vibrio splendidus]|nr:hypothetical protein [Vibrio splendidus]MCC4879443.1 hypothetical protein [Vibrio splendidus]